MRSTPEWVRTVLATLEKVRQAFRRWANAALAAIERVGEAWGPGYMISTVAGWIVFSARIARKFPGRWLAMWRSEDAAGRTLMIVPLLMWVVFGFMYLGG